ncbi:TIGR01459 family HAD-type hydrolase [Bartonella sp. DGB1]|uniref:TIGR01459 family HAD-type hydrolase n=1 Tax=Bartonella sp. DGB1 TaxID=3239807 RepID=UPI0035261BD2
MQRIKALNDIIDNYKVIFCDVWGVLHNGEKIFDPAVEALLLARRKGKIVICVTNSPRLSKYVQQQLSVMGLDKNCYNKIVTSGDVTRSLITQYSRKIFHIGHHKDKVIFDGLDIELVAAEQAESIVCTGLFDDKPYAEDYINLLKYFSSVNLPFICANPDLIVDYKGQLRLCAGTLAKLYEEMGGATFFAGKPFAPIYDLAREYAQEILQAEINNNEILAIGDGLLTDVKGANQQNIDILYIDSGIHRNLSNFELRKALEQYNVSFNKFMAYLA